MAEGRRSRHAVSGKVAMAPVTLVSFLGRSPREAQGYRKACYRFSDGREFETAYFGFSLASHIQPDRLVVFGTAGSMWDHLVEHFPARDTAAEEERLALMEAVERQAVTQAQLDALAPALSRALGCSAELKLISHARDEVEQVGLVKQLSEAVPDDCNLHLDITHSFRHLPLIALMALQYLRALRPTIRLEAIWYGSYDPDEHKATVYNLAGLLHIADGSSAIARFDQSGDYALLAGLVSGEAETFLKQAAFLERTNQTGQARGQLDKARRQLEQAGLSGLGALFEDALTKRISWVDESKLYQRQRALAWQSLGRGDELRAALYGFEAFITRLMQQSPQLGQLQPDKFDHRDRAKADFEARKLQGFEPTPDYLRLRDLRNQLAHGLGSAHGDTRSVMASEQKLRQELGRLFEALLPQDA